MASRGLAFSDRRLKTDIRPVGEIEGTKLYKYRFKGDTATRLDFMADEVPVEYKVAHPSGFEMVDYGRLLDI